MPANTIGRPPGPDGLPFIGQAFAYRNHPADFLLKLSRDYGDICHFRVGRHHMYLLNRPDFVEEVLVRSSASYAKGRILQRAKSLLGEGLLTSEGTHHLRQRRLMQPAFHRERLAQYAETMAECSVRARESWQPGERDIAQDMMRLTLAIVARTLFSVDTERDASRIGRALTDVLSLFDILVLPFSEVLEYLPLPSVLRARRARFLLDRTINRLISDRRRSGIDTGDLLSTLLLAKDEDGSGGMSDRQIRDEVMTLFLAGHETTANALTWTWYLLSQHPEVESRFRQEIRDVLGDRLPRFEDLPDLPYTEMVLAESMRLYPPAWAIGRLAKANTRIFNYVVPKGSVCLVSPYTMHRHPRYWPEPERFDPDRFLPEPREARPKFAYFPFGGGVRKCIGEGFAWVEGVLLLAVIAQRWRMRLSPGHVVATHPQITLRPRHGMRMILERV